MELSAPAEVQTTTDRLISRTPWWAISVGLHATLALLLAFFVVLVKPQEDEEAVVVSPCRPPRPVLEYEPEKQIPRDKTLDIPKQSEEVSFVKKDDHAVTTDDQEPWEKPKGDSPEFVDREPFKSKSTNSTIGPNGGAKGKFGGRLGGGHDKAQTGGGGKDTQDAVLDALRWLARHQSPDGSWRVRDYFNHCKADRCAPNPGHGDFDAGVTGLALLAFLGAGFSHLSCNVYDGINFGEVVRKAVKWIVDSQDSEGCIGPKTADQYMYNHTICALALCEAYGLTGARHFKESAQKAVDFTVAAQNPEKGWRYSARSGDNDTSVTGWAAMVLKAAEMSELRFPRTAYDGVRNWLDEVTDGTYYSVGYTRAGTGLVHNDLNKDFQHHEALTAIAMMSRIFIDKNQGDPRLAGGSRLLLADLPKWDGLAIDYYYWYYGSLALFQFDGPKGPKWTKWNGAMKDALIKNQNLSAGCKKGSWEPIDRWSGDGGRVYSTAINALTLEVYYRYANVFGVR